MTHKACQKENRHHIRQGLYCLNRNLDNAHRVTDPGKRNGDSLQSDRSQCHLAPPCRHLQREIRALGQYEIAPGLSRSRKQRHNERDQNTEFHDYPEIEGVELAAPAGYQQSLFSRVIQFSG